MKRRYWLAGAAVVVVAFGAWWAIPYGDMSAPIHVPNPQMPSPNARDFYIEATMQMADGRLAEEAVEGGQGPRGEPFTLERMRELLAKNQRALETLRYAFQFEYREVPCRTLSQAYWQYPAYRELSNVLRLEGRVRAAKGDWAGAVASYIDALRMAANFTRGGLLFADMIAHSVEASVRKDLWKAVDHLSAADAAKASRALEEIESVRATPAQLIEEDKWGGLAVLREAFDNPEVLRALTNDSGEGWFWGRVDSWRARRKLAAAKAHKIVRDYTAYIDQVIAQSKLPYPRQHLSPMPTERITSALLPYYGSYLSSVAAHQSRRNLLIASFALRAYRLDHGRYPGSLSELVPGYLKQVPGDPFALSGPLRYRPAGDKYLLYSIGPDGKDDGGKPIPKTGDTQRIESGSKGDIVPG